MYSLSAELSSKHIFFLSESPDHQTDRWFPPPPISSDVDNRDHFRTLKSLYRVSFLSLADKREVGRLRVGVDEWLGDPPPTVRRCCRQSRHAAFEVDFLLTCWCSSWSGCWLVSVHPGCLLWVETEEWTQHEWGTVTCVCCLRSEVWHWEFKAAVPSSLTINSCANGWYQDNGKYCLFIHL